MPFVLVVFGLVIVLVLVAGIGDFWLLVLCRVAGRDIPVDEVVVLVNVALVDYVSLVARPFELRQILIHLYKVLIVVWRVLRYQCSTTPHRVSRLVL